MCVPGCVVSQVCCTAKSSKGHTSPEFLHGAKALLRNRDKGIVWSVVPLSSQALAEMKAEKLVENDFLVAASTFNFLNWFSLPTEVRVCRHKTNWFQILIPLTAELSRGLPAIDLQSIQTQLMCNGRRRRRRTSLLLVFIPPYFLLLYITDDVHSFPAFGYSLITELWWMMLCSLHFLWILQLLCTIYCFICYFMFSCQFFLLLV